MAGVGGSRQGALVAEKEHKVSVETGVPVGEVCRVLESRVSGERDRDVTNFANRIDSVFNFSSLFEVKAGRFYLGSLLLE
jgi:hypothetical protein